jgi:hypothetical protein
MIEQQQDTERLRVVQVGPDRVTIKDHEVIIEAKHKMPEWQVRDLNPPPVYFEDKKYQLIHATRGDAPYEARYILKPWPEGQSSSSKLFYSYDAEAVAERDGAVRSGQAEGLARACLLPFYPFLGLLWSGVQRALCRFGFAPHAITGISIFATFCFSFAQGVFAVVTINTSLRSGKMIIGGCLRAMCNQDHLHLGPISIPIVLLDGLLTLACLADVAIRYSHYLREEDWAGGFLEWLFRWGAETRKVEAAE